MIVIVDYGMGNLRSVQNALEHINEWGVLTREPSTIRNARRLILPGVGAFGAAIDSLRRLGLVDAIRDYAQSGRPLLGICLGMQLLLTRSEEQGDFEGLDIIHGRVRRLFNLQACEAQIKLKIPHTGWNTVVPKCDSPLLRGIPNNARMYFVHSYYADPMSDAVGATTEYGISFCSVISKGNVFATQFHPEKSGSAGLKILANFAALETGE